MVRWIAIIYFRTRSVQFRLIKFETSKSKLPEIPGVARYQLRLNITKSELLWYQLRVRSTKISPLNPLWRPLVVSENGRNSIAPSNPRLIAKGSRKSEHLPVEWNKHGGRSIEPLIRRYSLERWSILQGGSGSQSEATNNFPPPDLNEPCHGNNHSLLASFVVRGSFCHAS